MGKRIKMIYLFSLITLLVLGFNCTTFAMDTAEQSYYPGNSFTVGIKPLFSVEYERRLTSQLDLVINYSYFPNIFGSKDDDFTMYSLGFNYYPASDSMQGFYIGAEVNRFKATGDFLGIDFNNNSYDNGYAVSIGYKNVFDSGFAFDCGVKGYYFEDETSGASPFITLGYGW